MHPLRPVVWLLFAVVGAALARAEAAAPLVWNGNPAAPHLDIIGDEPARPLEPVRIVGARNGRFSGKVVVCANGPLKNVSAKIGDLKSLDGKATIPASRVQVRLATGWIKSGWNVQPKAGSTFDVLNESAPLAEVAPIVMTDRYHWEKYHTWVKTGRSYVPVWVTVSVPPDAAAGEYSGTLAVRVGEVSRDVPVSLTVHAWALPDPKDYRTWIEAVQSPDTLALEYDVPLWSDKHWQLIEQSLRLGALLGNKSVYFPLLCESNLGNAESAIRWIKRPDGGYTHDLSIVERYLDLQTRIQGKPRVVCFVVWDTFLEGGQFSGDIKFESKESREERLAYKGKGPEVTLLDPASGKTEKHLLPPHSDPGGAALWAPLLKALPELLAQRGLGDALFFGIANDSVPHQATLDLVSRNVPDAKWVIHAHSFYGGKDKKANFQYAAFVWGVRGFCSGEKGWENPFLLAQFLRNMRDHYPLTTYRLAPEVNITGGQRGVGRIGLDSWPVLKNVRGVRATRVTERYPKASWRNLNITDALLAPGPEGPLGTARFEMLREGVQECEARIFVQTALDGGKLPAPLADECRTVLADRDAFLRKAAIVQGTGRPWFADAAPSEEAYLGYAEGWQEHSARLYRAAEAIAKQGAR